VIATGREDALSNEAMKLPGDLVMARAAPALLVDSPAAYRGR
jgi:hypothetical protein